MARITEQEARALGLQERRLHKYRAQATRLCVCGCAFPALTGQDLPHCPACGAEARTCVWFPSKKQALRFQALRQLEKQGVIRSLERELRIKLVVEGQPLLTERGRPIHAVMDAAYFEGERRVFEDSKGKDLALSELKRAILRVMFPTAKIIIS